MDAPFRPASPAEELPSYYEDLCDPEILSSFRDFDNTRNFDLFDRQTRNPRSSNFVVDFGDDDAYCAFDLGADSISRLLSAQRPGNLHTRWINLWVPYMQKDVLHVLAKHYDFSPRLLGMMCSEPLAPRSSSLRKKQSENTLGSGGSARSRKSQRSRRSAENEKEDFDSEESIGMTEMMHSTQLDMVRDLSHYHIVDEVWHWSTVDWGRHFVCLGYNSLHDVRSKTPQNHNDEVDKSRDIPLAKRVWNWLLLTEDKTVISISEDPFPFTNGSLSAPNLRMLYTTRRNLVSVFRQLTKAPTPLREASLIMLPIRHRIGNSDEETAHRPTDAPGLLFYYLFEDWFTTYSLVTRREHGYASELDRLRQDMLHRASLSHVDQLHHIGCQLSVLKRVYLAYNLIIERVLKKQEATLASLKNSRIVSGVESLASSIPGNALSGPQVPEADSLLGVSLSSAARVRFERLKDRIALYALSEIQECVDQKEALVMMNFNLIAIKESYSVERLTRITLLLAKPQQSRTPDLGAIIEAWEGSVCKPIPRLDCAAHPESVGSAQVRYAFAPAFKSTPRTLLASTTHFDLRKISQTSPHLSIQTLSWKDTSANMDVYYFYSYGTAAWMAIQAAPMIASPTMIVTLLSPEVREATTLEVYFSRCLGLALLTVGVLNVLLTGSVPLSSRLTEGATTSAADPKAPYALPTLTITAFFHAALAFYGYAMWTEVGIFSFGLGTIGSGFFCAIALWCILFASSDGRISRKTGADKRTSGFPFKNNKAHSEQKKGR
ncbi:hypothetical protein GRF29_106g386842 [Pseudopithomyces chartarum]|uniref:Uncharacterized protein n=1 Tax=Pseudopithomyces chartarum TaxID=1892770 RepID=A0AAN6LSM0_9PLEO|nr:hypothetical protein GRF29_106g386842 [Pseudopithomyces chartarum]